MKRYNPNIHHRRSIRLKGYDYSQAGLYFITIVTQNRIDLFGEIKNGEMILNDAGKMVEKWYYELENKFPDIKRNEIIVMPNHTHFIIQNTVGADLRVCPDLSNKQSNKQSNMMVDQSGGRSDKQQVEHVGSPLRSIVQWFKTMSTNEYIRGVKNKNWQSFDGKFWQRNYWEHIIRNENEYNRISQYIINNPAKWENDKLNGGDGNIVMEPSADYNSEIWMI